MGKGTQLGALGAALGAAIGSLCCLPFAAALGASVAAAGAFLVPLQPYMTLTSVTLLLVAFVQTARSAPCKDGEGCSARSRRRRWLLLGATSLLTLFLITLPYWSAYLVYWSL